MPSRYARFLLGSQRTLRANRQLGFVLAFVAGAINAGGFLAVQQYTSHVTGMVSAAADNLALGHLGLVADGAIAVLAFLLGAITCSLMVNFARRKAMASEYALPLLLESVLILCFGLAGAQLATFDRLLVPFTVLLLCFIMGLQNAVVTKLSSAVIRTTHLTGIVTDLGIAIGGLLHRHLPGEDLRTDADRAAWDRIGILSGLVAWFSTGAVAGAFGFQSLGYVFTVPMALLLAVLALVPAFDDFRRLRDAASRR